jgi:hypothetical protein
MNKREQERQRRTANQAEMQRQRAITSQNGAALDFAFCQGLQERFGRESAKYHQGLTADAYARSRALRGISE